MLKVVCTLSSLLFLVQASFAQNQVALTIDDVPNTSAYQANGFESPLMRTTDSLRIPVTIFIVESKIYATDHVVQNFALLNQWIRKDYVTPGNHSFTHRHYSTVGFGAFTRDLLKGEAITGELAAKAQKALKYFRFPYNDLGTDSTQHDSIARFLTEHGYRNAPFTIESSDYMFNSLYAHYLRQGQPEKAAQIGRTYIEFTLTLFDFFEQVSADQYHRPIRQIYLCHDSALNARYLPELVKKLRARNYTFISLGAALQDPVYQHREYYQGKWGYSWVYRWMEDKDRRSALMKKEPFLMDIYEEYKKINSVN